MVDNIIARGYQHLLAFPVDHDRIVGHEAMSPLDQVEGDLRLAEPALADEQHAYSVDVDHGSVVLLVLGKLVVEKIRDQVYGLGRRMARDEYRNAGGRRHLDQFIVQLVVTGENNAGNLELHEVLESLDPCLVVKLVEKTGFGVAENLDALVGKKIGKTRKSQARTVEIAFENPPFLLIHVVQTAKFDIETFADILVEIRNRHRSLFKAFLIKVHGTET